MLGAFLFRGDDVFKTLDVLSGGEKSRVALLQLLLRPVNLLVLDEPTNHLDMHSKDVLLDALKDFGGTVVFVSHDRGFIEGLANRVLELTPGRFRFFPGDYAYYQARLEAERNGTDDGTGSEPLPSASAQADGIVGGMVSDNPGPSAWEEEKRIKADRRRKEREVEHLESEIDRIEKQKKAAENQLADPAVYSDGEKCRKIQQAITELSGQLEDLNSRWETAAGELS
jgi:ATP-binding cassette subfamily F protein 3